jgi:hypothetical protein
MSFDVIKINKILQSVDFNSIEDFQYNKGKCWEMWIKDFYTKNNRHEQSNQQLSFIEKVELMKKFEKTQATEADFKQAYPDFKYDKYISPWDYDYKLVSKNKIQKVAFELQDHIQIDFHQLCDLVQTMYWMSKPDQWNFETLVSYLMSYDSDLYLKAMVFIQLTKKQLVACFVSWVV